MIAENNEIVLIADPRVLQIPIQENQDVLIDLKEELSILFGPSPEIENNTCYTKIRSGVFDRLVLAESLLPKNLRLCLYEGLRSLSLQEHLYETRWNKIKTLYPSWSDPEIYHEVIKMVSPVKTLEGVQNIPPHATGAAVDVYLVDTISHLPVDMGILAKDWMLDPEGVLSKTDSNQISKEAQKNRGILNQVMTQAGFVNYPTEYWHWSFGDRYWAWVSKKPYAIYDVAQF